MDSALGISLVFRLYFTVYPSSCHNTEYRYITFDIGLLLLFPCPSPQDKAYAEAMFAFFDTDGSGTLDINEYMHASSVHEDTPKDKVRLDADQRT